MRGTSVAALTFMWFAVGSALEIYGVVLNSGPAVAAYAIDGGVSQNVSMPLDNATYPVYNWNFIPSKINLEEGIHNITITSLLQSSTTLYLDYILITASKAYIPPPVLISPGSGVTSSYSTPTSSSPALDNGRHSSHIGAIAGGSVGGVLLLGVLIAVVLFLRRDNKM